jgi:hypothetical protein
MANVSEEQLRAREAGMLQEVSDQITPTVKREVLPYNDAFDFAQVHFPEHELYRWQIEALLQLSGYSNPYEQTDAEGKTTRQNPTKEAPLIYTLCAANGSGKDQIVLAIWALYCLTCKPDLYWIGTSSSAEQLDGQTWYHIKKKAQALNAIYGPRYLKITKFRIQCSKTGSMLRLFRSDEDKLTEGFHPLVENGQMVIALNECKSLDESVIMAFKRCHGVTHWLNISSPGDPTGHFYEACANPHAVWPQPIILGKKYFRRVTVHDCPHLQAEFKRHLEDFDINTPFIRSSFLAEFTDSSILLILPPERIVYKYPEPLAKGLARRCGIDLGFGGDVTVMSIWEGNSPVAELEFNISYEPALTTVICAKLDEHNVQPMNTYVDGGGQGSTVIDRMHEAGYAVNKVQNNNKPINPRAYVNRGAELAFNFRRLILDQVLNLKNISPKLKTQMSKRHYFHKETRIQLESKIEFRARFGYSPDHFDAAILAHAGCNIYVFKALAEEKPKDQTGLNQPSLAELKKNLEEMYGTTSNKSARAGEWRTSGVFGRRYIGSPLRRITQSMA